MTEARQIRLQRHFFTRLEVKASPMFDAAAVTGLVNAKVNSSMALEDIPGEPTVACTQTVRLTPGDDRQIPYELDVECVGFFTSDKGPMDTIAHNAVALMAHQVLYSAAREMIITMTGRMAWGPFSIGLAVLQAAPPAVPQIEATKPASVRRVRRKPAAA